MALFIWLQPDLPEVFFEVVGTCERFIELKGFRQTFFLSFCRDRDFQDSSEEAIGFLSGRLLEFFFRFTIEISSEIGEFVIEELDHMEMVKDNGRFGKMRQERR